MHTMLLVVPLTLLLLLSAAAGSTSNCGKQDIMFLVDSSGSISDEKFDAMKEFMISFIGMMGEYGENGMKVSVVVFAKHSKLKIVFKLNEYCTKQQVINAIRTIEKFPGRQSTHLYHAIKTSLPEVMAEARVGVAQAVLIILTDGKAKDEKFFKGAAKAAISKFNVEVFPVGISSDRDERQLKDLAGPNRVTYVEGYDALASHLSDLAGQTCPTTTTLPPEKPTVKPTEKPTEKPTVKPTEKPTEKPTSTSTIGPAREGCVYEEPPVEGITFGVSLPPGVPGFLASGVLVNEGVTTLRECGAKCRNDGCPAFVFNKNDNTCIRLPFNTAGAWVISKQSPGSVAYFTDCQDIDYCRNTPCKNAGTCQPSDNGFYCICLYGWKGEHCGERDDSKRAGALIQG